MNIDESWFASREAGHPIAWDASRIPSHLSPLFNACDRLEKAILLVVSRRDTDFYSRTNAVEQATLPRLLHTFDALLRLAALGYGTPAMVLARTLIEDTFALWWLGTRDLSDLATRLSDHEKSVSLKMQGHSYPAAPYLGVATGLPEIPAEDEARIAEEFAVDQRLGHRHWTGKQLRDLAKAARDRMRPQDQAALDVLLGKPLLLANLMTHNSPASLTAPMVAPGLGLNVTSRAQTTTLVQEALAVAYECLTLAGVWAATGKDLENIDILTARDRPLFIPLPAGAKAGRNDPCPCGSDRKYKKCHGAVAR